MTAIDEMLTATPVEEDEKITVLPRLFSGPAMLLGEASIYNPRERLCEAYKGGQWVFMAVSNGGLFLMPKMQGPLRLVNADNYTDVEVSPEAAGIIVTIYALSLVMGLTDEDNDSTLRLLVTRSHQLKEYAAQHPEAAKIGAAID